MAAVTETITAGATLFAAAKRPADDQFDNKTGTTYTHSVYQFSATVFGEVMSELMYIETAIQAARNRSYI